MWHFQSIEKQCSRQQTGEVITDWIAENLLLLTYSTIYLVALDIPHILTHLEIEERLEASINIYPSQKVLNSAIFDVMKFLNWTKCAIIYDQNDGEWGWMKISFHFLIYRLKTSLPRWMAISKESSLCFINSKPTRHIWPRSIYPPSRHSIFHLTLCSFLSSLIQVWFNCVTSSVSHSK